jgi:hypothetical protein
MGITRIAGTLTKDLLADQKRLFGYDSGEKIPTSLVFMRI